MIKKTYSENQAMVEKLWKKYQKDNNPKWLADICLNVPFFDHPEVGKEIAKLLKQINHKIHSPLVRIKVIQINIHAVYDSIHSDLPCPIPYHQQF